MNPANLTAAERDTQLILSALNYRLANDHQSFDERAEIMALCERLSAPVADKAIHFGTWRELRPDEVIQAGDEWKCGGTGCQIFRTENSHHGRTVADVNAQRAPNLPRIYRRRVAQPPQAPEPVNAELLNALVNADYMLRELIANHDIRLTEVGQRVLAKIDQEKARAESALAAQKCTP